MTGSSSRNRVASGAFDKDNDIPEPQQVRTELEALLDVINDRRSETIVEIGTASGGTFYHFCNAVDDVKRTVSIDRPGISPSGQELQTYNEDISIHGIHADSQAPETRDELESILNGDEIDVLLIDADHSYEGVETDYELYSELAADDALIIFHDIVVHDDESDIEVDDFWDDIDPKGTKAELVDESYGPPYVERDGWEIVAHGFGIIDRDQRLSGRHSV